MKLKHLLLASAVSFAFSSVAFAAQHTQAQAGEPEPQDKGAQQQAPGAGGMEQQQPAQDQGAQQQAPGAGGMEQQQPAQDQGAQQQQAPEAGAAGAQAGGQQMHDQQTVRKVQEKLKEEGYSVGQVDGIWGPQTEQALTQYQQAKGLEASGQLDEQTMSALGIEAEAGAAGAQETKPAEGAGGAEAEKQEKPAEGAGGAEAEKQEKPAEAGTPGGAGAEQEKR